MPRVSRKNLKTLTSTYHIIIRGNNKQKIFLCDNDREKLINLIKNTKEEYKYKLYLFVLMSNHVHIVIYDQNDNISKIMHKLCSSYAKYFNNKYDRVGHLFQDRYKSISVNDEKYLFNLISYIHNNPCKAQVSSLENYKWSSYKDYIGNGEINITDTEFILSLFDEDKEKALNQFIIYNKKVNNREYLKIELEVKDKLTDKEAITYIKEFIHVENLSEILSFNTVIRNKYIYKISQIEGIEIGQIARIFGISKRTVMRIVEKKKKNIEPVPKGDTNVTLVTGTKVTRRSM